MGEISNAILSDVQQIAGTDLSVFDMGFIEGVISNRMAENACGTLLKYLDLLKKDPDEAEHLKNNLLVGYSQFFRNSLTYSVLEKIVLPQLIINSETSGRGIRIWSSACSAGQEPYSLAILLEEIRERSVRPLNYHIFASDLSRPLLEEAIRGVYSASMIKNVSYERLNQWFERTNGSFHIGHRLKKNIDFSLFDLLDDRLDCPASSIYGTFDIIVCANMLFYYQPDIRVRILNKLLKCLDHGGFLVTGETERDLLLAEGFKEAYPYAAIFVSKMINYEHTRRKN